MSVTIDELATNTFDFPCGDGDGATGPREPGTYQVLVELLAGDRSTLSSFAPIEATIIDGPADLGDFTFSVGTACDASTCATGCCDENGDCVEPQTDSACGRSGATCTDCAALDQVCNVTEGLCIE